MPARDRILHRLLGLGGLGAFALVTLLSAQVQVEVTPVVGLYRPLERVIAAQYLDLTGRPGAAFGGRVSVWATPHYGLSASYAYSAPGATYPTLGDCQSLISADRDGCPPFSTTLPSAVQTASLQFVFRTRVFSQASLSFGAGPAVVHGSYDFRGAYSSGIPAVGGPMPELTATSGGAALSAGAQSRIAHTPLAIRVSVEDYIYAARFPYLFTAQDLNGSGVTHAELSDQGQNDVLATIGFSVTPADRHPASPCTVTQEVLWAS
jgi:hypothetical protein